MPRRSARRRRRFDESGLLEHLFDDTIKRAMVAGLISRHVSADGTLVRANASYKSFVPLEVALDPDEYKRRLRAQDWPDGGDRQDPGNPAVDFRGEKRSNATHRSATDPDCRFVSKRSLGTVAYPGYRVNAVMENRHRFLPGLGVETFQGGTSEKRGCLALLDRARRRLRFRPATLGADKRFFHEDFIEAMLAHGIEPHIAVEAARQRSGARASAHAGARPGLPTVAALSEADRGTVRRRQGLARAAPLPASRPRPRAAGGVLDRLGPQSEASRKDLVAGAATDMTRAATSGRRAIQRASLQRTPSGMP
jgi:hypothetical protein